jgi:predicted anti-sigma-YlaC factor YlaD
LSGRLHESCDELSPLFGRIVDGEATPEEALLAAQHLSDCTSCRIILAREQRLAAILEQGMEDPLQVSESFVTEVMARLPQDPPPPPKRKSKRRNLKLASFAGLVGVLIWQALRSKIGDSIGDSAWSLIPRLTPPETEGFSEGATQVGVLMLTAMDHLAGGMAFNSGGAYLGLFALLTLLVALSTGIAASAGAAWVWLSSGDGSNA